MQPQTDAADAEGLDTGTTVVGIVADGETDTRDDQPAVVVATDRRASLGRMVSSKSVQKVQQLSDRAAMAFSGSVSGADALTQSLRTEISLYETRRAKPMSPTALGNLVANSLRENQFGVQPVVAAVDSEERSSSGREGHSPSGNRASPGDSRTKSSDDAEARLFSYDGAGGRTEVDYAAVGSGTPYAYGHLEDAYEEGLSVDAATDLAEQAVAVATERDTASGNGLCLAVVTPAGVDIDVKEAVGA